MNKDRDAWRFSILQSEDNSMLAVSQTKEFSDLMDHRVVILVPRRNVDGHHMYKTRFVDKTNYEGTSNEFVEQRFVVMPYCDEENRSLSWASTVQHSQHNLPFETYGIKNLHNYSIQYFSGVIASILNVKIACSHSTTKGLKYQIRYDFS